MKSPRSRRSSLLSTQCQRRMRISSNIRVKLGLVCSIWQSSLAARRVHGSGRRSSPGSRLEADSHLLGHNAFFSRKLHGLIRLGSFRGDDATSLGSDPRLYSVSSVLRRAGLLEPTPPPAERIHRGSPAARLT